ncbi:unnamed protein product [Schistocephalus solidus]|uniref:C2H2-type domain-containing protein n=1 Tax=Schistocephalus solidus TaxID=70667 RepID=A0A183S8V6_SCHSO|nr:unnamed protein product [Schistocephalus solidus]
MIEQSCVCVCVCVCALDQHGSHVRARHAPPFRGAYGGPRRNQRSNCRVSAAKTKRTALKSPAPRTNTANAQTLPTCPHCQRTIRALIGLVGHLRTQCTKYPTIPTSTSNSANTPSKSPSLTPGIRSIAPTIIEITSQYSSPVTPTTPTTSATTTTTTDEDSLLNCPLQAHIHLTHRSGRSLANPSYRHW